MLSHDNQGARMRPTRISRRTGVALALTVALTAGLTLAGPPAPLTAALPRPVVAMIAPAAAYAGAWAQVTCTQPLIGLPPAPSDGWAPFTGAGSATNGCDPYAGGLVAALSDAAPQFDGVGAAWRYTAPAGSTIAGGNIVFSLYSPQGRAYVTTGNFENAIARCQAGSPCGGQVGGSSGVLNLRIAPAGGTSLSATAECFSPGNGDCAAGAGGSGLDAQVNVYQAVVELTNNSTPAASSFGGGLLTPGPISGTQAITLVASDPNGPGVYRIKVAVDGQSAYEGTPDTSQGHCVPVATSATGAEAFLYAQPCKQVVNFGAQVPTAALADGAHALTVTVTDAAGNSSVVLQQSIVTANYTTVSAKLDGTVRTPSGATPAPGYSIVLDPATQALAHGARRGFASSALTVSGTLSNPGGIPVPGVPLALLAQNGDAGAETVIARTTTDAAGRWTLNAPRGPSRTLTITYGSQAQTAATGTGVTIKETVTPGLSLNVKALGRGRLRFTGQLNVSPLGAPRPLVIVEAAFKRNPWQVVARPVAVSSAGRFTLSYTSGAGSIGFPFKFRAVSAATNLFTAATSPTRNKVIR
jgi:hypothetical protein